MKSPLPVPEIFEEDFSFKQPRGTQDSFHMRRPPKIQHPYNRSLNASVANAISFRLNDSRAELSSLYNRSRPETYYEQCFEQLKKVGEGSFGEVFKVRSRTDGRLYAVKKSKTFFRSSHCRSNCLEEVRQYEQFSDHENCVKLYQAWEQDDRLYMQMELCRENLEVYAREQQQLSDERIWSILLDLLLALKSLHDRNLIHLDIKLDNILVTDDGTCKLADFGLVFDLTKGKTEDAMEGDSRYLAPELMAGRYTKAADIFSLGIATLELTCNLELPRNGRMWQRLRSGQPLPENLARKISPPLREIIVRMMKPLPEDRPTVDALLNHPIIRKLHQSRKRRSYFRRKLSSLWRFVVTAVMWFAACLRLQHRKFPADSTETDVAEHGVKEQSIRTNHDASSCCGSAMNISNASSGNRNGVSFGASRSFQDQASSLLADEDDMFDDLSSFESSPCSRNAGNIRAHFLRESFQDDSSDIDKNSAQVTPTLNNSIPVHTPTVRIVNSTPLNHHHLQHHLQNGQLPLHHGRNDSRHSSRVLWSPSRLLCFDEDFDDPSTSENGPTRRVHSTPCQVPLLNDSDSDIRPLGPSPPNLNASLCGDASNDLLSPSATLRELSISSTPNCSLLRSASASGCDTPSTGFSSFLIKKKLCFNEENDSE